MKYRIIYRIQLSMAIAVLFALMNLTCAMDSCNEKANYNLEALYKKDKVTILLTDSGLGGLSVAAELERNLKGRGLFRNVQLVFANALPEEGMLYNSMESTAEKVGIFSNALDGMYRRYNPDIILIACNTLSVIYDETEFSKKTSVPVVGIVDFGVDMIFDKLSSDSSGIVFIMGTPTTIGQNTHKENLIARGIAADRIFTQGCDMLESEIQSDPGSDIVKTMIEMYASDAWAKSGDFSDGNIYVGLCCTHYGYAFDSFKEGFENITDKDIIVLDPNQSMSSFLIKPEYTGRYDNTDITAEVISRAVISEDAIESIGRMIVPISISFAEALRNYKLDMTLFDIGK